MTYTDEIIEVVNNELNGILRANLYEIGLKEEELKRLRSRKRELREALKNCGIGDVYAKEYVKGVIRNIFLDKLVINEEKLNRIISFSDRTRLTVKDKFDIVLFLYKKIYGNEAFLMMTEEYALLEPVPCEDGFRYAVSAADIEEIFFDKYEVLTFDEMLELSIQRVYERYKGLGVIDELRDMRIDGISGGVSGREGDYKSVWVFVKGKTVHLSFLDFESEGELERICMNIYRYSHSGYLSMAKGYVVNEMYDHSRVVVARPPFAESFVFFVRKFDSIVYKELEQLLTDEEADCVIDILRWIVKGCQVCAITGTQGSGKTTLLMAMIRSIPPVHTLRIQELSFELHLREIYPDRNIVTFQETEFITGQEGLDLQKKTDGVVNILGEVASAPVASWLIQMSMVASLFTMFTHHAKNTDYLIHYLRNCLLTDGGFTNEVIAKEQVIDTVRFDIHMERELDGHRYVQRITEIVPDKSSDSLYRLNTIVEYQNGRYVQTGWFSGETAKEIFCRLGEEEQQRFLEKYHILCGEEVLFD